MSRRWLALFVMSGGWRGVHLRASAGVVIDTCLQLPCTRGSLCVVMVVYHSPGKDLVSLCRSALWRCAQEGRAIHGL